MIDRTSALPTIFNKLKKLPPKYFLDLKTFKKDRSITIVKKSGDNFLVIENGFNQEMFEVDIVKMKKLLKILLKREFPRSNKIRLYSGLYEGSKKS